MSVDIRNTSGCSRKLRIVPLKSPYFTVTRGLENISRIDLNYPH